MLSMSEKPERENCEEENLAEACSFFQLKVEEVTLDMRKKTPGVKKALYVSGGFRVHNKMKG